MSTPNIQTLIANFTAYTEHEQSKKAASNLAHIGQFGRVFAASVLFYVKTTVIMHDELVVELRSLRETVADVNKPPEDPELAAARAKAAKAARLEELKREQAALEGDLHS